MIRRIVCCSILVLAWMTPLSSHAENTASAWEVLVREHPLLIEEVSELERELFQMITSEQVKAYLNGTRPTDLVLLNGETLDVFLRRKGVSNFSISWDSIDGGGGIGSTGGVFAVSGTIGQSDTGTASGGGFVVTGGFWPIVTPPAEDPCVGPAAIFCDTFEDGTTNHWALTIGG